MKLKNPLLLSLLLASCATHHEVVKPNEKPVVAEIENNKHFFNRNPSSSETEERLNVTFDTIMSQENPANEFLNYIRRVKDIYVRSEAYLAEFDKELESNPDFKLEESNSYKKLLVMRALSARAQDKITYFYIKLTDMAYDKGQIKAQRKLAKGILKSFKQEIGGGNPVQKLAFEDLRMHIAQGLKTRFGSNKSTIAQESPDTGFKNDSERTNLIKKYRAEFISMGNGQKNIDDSLNKVVEDEVDKLQLIDNQNSREPQSEKKFYPSTGGNGNIMGLIFPRGTWALTYDDGPNPTHTAKIVSNLNELGIKATFFWLAQNVVQFQSTVDLVKQNGHALADHSWSHPQLPKLSDEQLNKEINKSAEVEAKAYGHKVEYFRCPYGAGNGVPKIRQRIADLGMIHVFWNVDTLDWQDKNPDSIVERAKKQMAANKNHGVILFHDIHPQSVIASKKLVEYTKTLKGTADEVRWVSIPQIVKEMNGE